MTPQKLQDLGRLQRRQALNMSGEQGIHEQYFFAGFGVGLYHRVAHRRVGGHGICQARPAPGFGQALFEAVAKIMDRNQPIKIALHP